MMTKFNVGDEVRIIKDGDSELIGKVGVITTDDGSDLAPYEVTFKHGEPKWKYGKYLELYVETPKKSARITALETQVSELQAKVEALEKAGQYPLTAQFERESPEVDGILADIVRKAKPTHPAANEQRADVIKRAKAYAAEQQVLCGRKVSYVVNADKRTVVALTHRVSFGRAITIYAKGIAKCDPDDVFNADIGKAIALARALGVDVPVEFVKAVQPTEKVYYHVVESEKYGKYIITPTDDPEGTHKYAECALVSPATEASRITEDSIAVYE